MRHNCNSFKAAFIIDGVTFTHIGDQNSNLGGKNITSAAWDWLTSVPTNTSPSNNIIPASAWAWMRSRDQKNGDVSDDGMLWYLLTGSEIGTPADYKARALKPLDMLPPMPSQGGTAIGASPRVSAQKSTLAAKLIQNGRTLNVTIPGIKGNASVTVCNLLSQVVYKNNIANGQSNFSLESLPVGTYLFSIESTNQKFSQKILLK